MPGAGINITHSDFHTFEGQGYVVRMIAKARDKSIPELKLMFQQTVDGWKTRPTFSSKLSTTGGSISISVYPEGPGAEIYNLVSSGSPPHTISPRTGGLLRFQPGYRSSTSPGKIQSSAYSRSGAFVTAYRVHHPGFEAREFNKAISDLYYPIFLDDMKSAMKA